MNRLAKLMCVVAAFWGIPVMNTQAADSAAWLGAMSGSRPLLLRKENPSRGFDSNAVHGDWSSQDADRIVAKHTGMVLSGSFSWENSYSAADGERVDTCSFTADDGSVNRFSVLSYRSALSPYAWTSDSGKAGENFDPVEFVRSRFNAEGTSSISWMGRLVSAADVEIRELGEVIAVPWDKHYFFLVDDLPGANWSHPCRYIFLSEDGSSFAVLYKQNPPRLFSASDGARIYLKAAETQDESIEKDAAKQLNAVTSKVYSYANSLREENDLSYSTGNKSKSHFVLICGGGDPQSNGIRFWCDTAMLYSTLTLKYGVSKDHIHVYMSDGESTDADANLASTSSGVTPVLVSSPLDLDGDGYSDIDGAATKSGVRSCFNSLASSLSSSDQLFVFITSHGSTSGTSGPNNYDSLAWLYAADGGSYGSDGERAYFWDEDLAEWTSGMACSVAFAIETCYSGGFIDDITQTPKRVIATACNHYETSYGSSGGGAWKGGTTGKTTASNCWARELISAFRGVHPRNLPDKDGYYYNAYPWEDDTDIPIDADSNGDGLVSFSEASAYAYENDSARCTLSTHTSTCGKDNRVEHPQYAESTTGLGDNFFMLKQTSSNLEDLEINIVSGLTSGSCSVENDGSTWKIVESFPSWVKGVSFYCSANGNLMSLASNGTTIGFSGIATMTVSCTTNDTGATRSWDMTISNRTTKAIQYLVHVRQESYSSVSVPVATQISIPNTYGYYGNTSYIQMTWTNVANATSYNVYRSESSSSSGRSKIATNVTSPYKDFATTSSLVPGKKYWYWVESVNSAGSSFSNSDWGNILVYASLSKTTLGFTAAGGTSNITVTANTSWTATTSDSWLSLSTSGTSGNGSISVTASANTSTTNRNGRIVVTAGAGTSYPKTVTNTVTQISDTASPVWVINDLGVLTYVALNGCSSVTIPDTVTAIGDGVFSNKSELVSITIPASVKRIGTGAFLNCQNLKNVSMEEGVTNIGNWAFERCTGLENMTLPNSVTYINIYAFYYCTSITNIIMGTGVNTINGFAFAYCNSLKSLVFRGNAPSEVRTTTFDNMPSSCAFYVTRDSTGWGVEIPGTWQGHPIMYLDEASAPKLPTALDNTSLTFTTGGSSSWFGQTSITHDGVDAAQSGALGNSQTNWLQTTVTGPGTISFWWYASSEQNWDFLEFLIDGVVVDSMSGTNNVWTSKSFTISVSGTHTLQWRYRKDGSQYRGLDAGFVDQVTWTPSTSPTPTTYTVTYQLNGGTHGATHPSSATYDTAFYVSAPTKSGYTFTGWTVTSGLNTSTAKWGTSSNPSTTISSSSTKCVNGATGNVYFTNLTPTSNGSVTLTANWTAASDFTYNIVSGSAVITKYTGSSSTVIIPSTIDGYTVTALADYAFHQSTITSITLPDSLTKMGWFSLANCRNLTTIHLPANVAQFTSRQYAPFGGNTSQATFTVAAENTHFTAVDGVLFTKDMKELISFPAGKNVESYEVPSSVTNIWGCAFDSCKYLAAVTIPEGVSSLMYCAFADSSKLTSVSLPESLRTIDYYVFQYCSSLKSLAIPAGVTTIGYNALNTSSLTNLVLWGRSGGGNYASAKWGASIANANIWVMPDDYDYWTAKLGEGLSVIAVGSSTYTVTYQPGSYASGSTYTATKTNAVALVLRGSTYTRTGYTQTGWSTSSAGTSKHYNLSASYTANSAITLYPYWTPNSYSVTYALNGGTHGATHPSSATYDTAFYVSAPTKSGYTFTGWTVTSGLNTSTAKWGTSSNPSTAISSSSTKCVNGATGNVYFKNLTPTPNGGVTLTANWTPVADLPDICPYTPTGWSGALVLSTESQDATTSTATSFSPNEAIYVSHAAVNLGIDFSNDFNWALYVDGSLRATGANWGSGLSANGYSRWQALPIGPLSVGTHTIKVVYDYTDLVPESNESNNTVTKTVTVSGAVVRPSNDDFADATVISGMAGSVIGSNVNATSQSGEPLPNISAGATNTIWWTWTAPANGIAQFSTAGSKVSYTAMGAYVGSSVSALTTVSASSESYSQSSISFSVVSGTRYYIAVSGTGYRYQGTIKLNWSMFTPVPLNTAVDNASLTFTTGGTANWVGVTNESYVGGSSARSGAISHSQSTWMQTEVSGAGTLSFWYKVSSESYCDKLIFYIDGVQKTTASGTAGWSRFDCVISNNTQHVVKWTYSKDGSVSSGSDCCWIDKVEWTPAGGSGDVTVDVGGGKSVTVPGTWLAEKTVRAATDAAANGRKVWECYVLGLNPEVATNEFKIVSFPMKADGTPDLAGIVFDPPQAQWNVPATWKVKGAATLEGPWGDVSAGGNPAYRFFKVEVVLP